MTFTTTLGAFVGAPAATPREIVVPAGSEGQALATLRAGTEPGTATVTAEVRSGDAAAGRGERPGDVRAGGGRRHPPG